MNLRLTFWQRIVLLILLMIVGLFLTVGVQTLLGRLTDNELAAMRITIVAQDLLTFILPALIVALLITRLPADFLCLRRMPSGKMTLLALATLLVSIPAIDGLNALCEKLPWPSEVLRLEEAAEAATSALLGPHTTANLIVSLLIMSVLTGLSEELFFRGALQNLVRSGAGVHVAVWTTAVIFALMHGQAIGIAARTLLGALFGYAVAWSGSLWLAVACHMLNNALAVATMWAGIDFESTPALSLASAALTAAGIYLMYRQSKSRSSGI